VTDVPAGSTPGSHGYLASDPDMETFLIAWGAGIRPGVRLGPVSSLDIAPTIAGLLGLAMPGTMGKPLTGLLK
jgi:predicted AlkP superfamily pyrophosphatase or phosphodiesterase